MSRLKLTTICILAGVMALAAGACGGADQDGDASDAGQEARVVEVAMIDHAFDPDSLDVSKGETVTFKFTNDGTVTHEAFIGDAEAQEEHGGEMETGMEGHNEGGEVLTLEPEETGQLTYTFDEVGEIIIGCHQPGHYEAGMKATVAVS